MPGTTIAELGKNPDQYNPFGMAFAPDGTLYFIDIHVVYWWAAAVAGLPTTGAG